MGRKVCQAYMTYKYVKNYKYTKKAFKIRLFINKYINILCHFLEKFQQARNIIFII